MRTWSGLLLLLLAACSGGDDDDAGFTACGGDPIAGWDLTTATFEAAQPDACVGGVSGFLFFNDNGRYSINLDIQAWKKAASDPACGFTAVYGGFYRVDGAKICLGDSSAEGDAIPCDGSRPTSLHATADFCVTGDTLELRTDSFLDPRVSTVLTLTRRP